MGQHGGRDGGHSRRSEHHPIETRIHREGLATRIPKLRASGIQQRKGELPRAGDRHRALDQAALVGHLGQRSGIHGLLGEHGPRSDSAEADDHGHGGGEEGMSHGTAWKGLR